MSFPVPANVSLQWQPGGSPASKVPRLARVLEGQVLRLTDGSPETGADAYGLNLPIFALLDAASSQAITTALPAISQAELDKQPATAPTD
jgi:hypothetical protein